MILYIFAICIAKEFKFSTSRGKKIDFRINQSKAIRSSRRTWAYVYFWQLPNVNKLREHNITLNPNQMVYKNIYKLFLIPSQISYLKRNNVSFRPLQPEDKIIDLDEIKNSTYLYVRGIFEQDIETTLFKVISRAKDFMIIETNYPEETTRYLSQLEEVEFISKHKEPKLFNSISSGFTQQNNFNITIDSYGNPSLPRYLESKGITGKNQLVAFSDSPLDYHHTMFEDPNTTLKFNESMLNHRKIYYYFNEFSDEKELYKNLVNELHGTHVAGIIAGAASNFTSKINSYNGVAPEAKLIYFGNENTFANNFFNPNTLYHKMILPLFENSNLHVFSNSWGNNEDGNSPYANYGYDYLLYNDFLGEFPLFLFAAGNEADSIISYSICYPSSAKNVFSIAAADTLFYFEIFVTDGIKEIPIYLNVLFASLEEVITDKEFYLSKIDDFTLASGSKKYILFDYEVLVLFYNDNKKFLELLKSQIQSYNIYMYIFDISAEIGEIFIDDIKMLLGINTYMTTLQNGVLKEMTGKILSYENFSSYVMKSNSSISRASYSSLGPSYVGIIKPDIMAPGSFMYSAKSDSTPTQDHGSDDSDYMNHLISEQGTSMATPNAAGAAALISQYLSDGYYLNETVNVNPLLLKSILIASASRADGSSTPDCDTGHGLIDISKVLPFNDTDFGLRFTKLSRMRKGETHHIGVLEVNNNNVPLKIVLCSHDTPLEPDSLIPIFFDLDLIVVSPSKKIYIGNNRTQDTEHLTLNEKVIIPISEIEEGEYEIHVILNKLNEEEVLVPYVVCAVGPFTQNDTELNPIYIEMNATTNCLPLENGICENGRMKCNEGYSGQLCRIQFNEFPNYKSGLINVIPPNTFVYFKISPQAQYDKLLITTICLNQSNTRSVIWELGSPDNYIPVLAENGNLINSFGNNGFDDFLEVDSKQEHYFMISNNFRDATQFITCALNAPHNGPLCFCENNQCTKSKCEYQNTYSDLNSLFGLWSYVNNRTIYIDHSYSINPLFMVYFNITLKLLNKEGPKHVITISEPSKINGIKLTAKDLILQLGDIKESTQTFVMFDYLNVKNVSFISNNHYLSVQHLITDFDSYSESLIKPYEVNISDTYNPIPKIKIYNDSIKLFTKTNEMKKFNFVKGMNFTLITNRTSKYNIKIINGEKESIKIMDNVSITIVFTNTNNCKIEIDESLNNMVKIISLYLEKSLLSKGAIIGISISAGIVAIVLVIIMIIVCKRKKNSNNSVIGEPLSLQNL